MVNSVLRKLKGILIEFFMKNYYGKFGGIAAASTCIEDKLIFPSSNFKMPLLLDIFGNNYVHFNSYETKIPSFNVRIFKKAYCFYDLENIFTKNKEVIREYTSQHKNPFIGKSRVILFHKKIKFINAKVAHLSLSGLEDNYYHFMTECIARLYLLQKSNFKPDFYIISHKLKFHKEFLELFGIKKEQILPYTNKETLLQISQLIVPDFINNYELVYYRDFVSYKKQWLPCWIADPFRNLINAHITNQESKIQFSNKRIYISRNKSYRRKVLNEFDVFKILEQYDISYFYLEDLTVYEQMFLFNRAQLIIGIHGAGLSNMKFSEQNTVIFEIYSQYYHDSSMRIDAVTLGHKYYYMIADSFLSNDGNTQEAVSEDLQIDVHSLDFSIKKIIQENNL